MSLRSKFFIVLALLGFTLGANVVLSVWSIRFLEQELAWPMRSSQPVLKGLYDIKRLGEQQAQQLGVGRFGEPRTVEEPLVAGNGAEDAPTVLAIEHQVRKVLGKLDEVGAMRFQSGLSTSENLHARSREIEQLANAWINDQSQDHYQALIAQIEARHELIERIEGRMIENAALANSYGQRLRVLIYSIIAIGVIGAALVTVYCVILLRRWVLQPVNQLRVGAQHYAQGAFDHNIQVRSNDELGQLGDEFNHMASMIQSMQDERIERERLAAMGEMAQRTVHNLRTPLAGIRALAETTQSELDPDSELREIQRRIISSVDRFEGWLQGMLRVSSPLQLYHRSYNPAHLINAVIESHRGAAESRTVAINLHVNEEFENAVGDPDQLEHAFTALLSNAIDYAPCGTSVDVTLKTVPDYWTLIVQDQGPGIPADLHASIFRPYFTTRKGGTGIGLALVHRIVDQHLGSIEVKSPPNGDSEQGTAFVMRVPFDARDQKNV
jgi:two-component system, NtrC family, sensor kinase